MADSDVKLVGNKTIIDGDFLEVHAVDIWLDNPGRRKRAGGLRRALVHGFNDELVLNFAGDYPNGINLQGNVGIGTSSPQAPLHLYSGANPATLRLQSSAGFGAARLEFWSDPQGSAAEWRPGYIQSTDQAGGTWTGGLAFFVNGSGITNRTGSVEVMRMTQGKVGIGTTTPNRKLQVEDEIHAGGTSGGLSFGNRNTSGFVNMPGNGERWVWYSTDGIARLWSGSDRLTVKPNGDVFVTGTLVQASSKTLKENIAQLSTQEAVTALKNLNPVKFSYKADPDKAQHIGFIAEDVPELVATPDRSGLSPMDIVSVLTKVVQEQQQTIAHLTQSVKNLEKQVKNCPA